MTNDPNIGRAYSESDAIARDIKEGNLSGFVGNGTALTGEANFKGMLRVDGHLTGRVSSQDGTLIVSTGGEVDANIEVSVAQIYGTVNGDIIATKRIELGRVAKVTGNVQTPALVIEQGAMFEGSCRMMHMQEAEQHKPQGVAANTPPAPVKPEPPRPAVATPPGATLNAPSNATMNAPNSATAPKPVGDIAAKSSTAG